MAEVTPAPGEAPELNRIDEFLRRAAPVLAAERGINARSQVKLRALARDLDLADEDFEAAISSLQRAPSAATASDTSQMADYRRSLSVQIERLPRGILTPALEANAIAVGEKHYALQAEQAEKILREVVAEKKVQRITRAEAEKFVANAIATKTRGAAFVDEHTAAQVHTLGQQWGLTRPQVEHLIKQHTSGNFRQQLHERKIVKWAIGAGAAIGVVLLVFLVWLMFFRPAPVADPSTDAVATDGGAVVPPVAEESVLPPAEWWDDRLSLAQTRARLADTGATKLYNGMASPDPEKRIAAYQQLIAAAGKATGDDAKLGQYQVIISGCYALDPDEKAATALREALTGSIPVRTALNNNDRRLPSSVNVYATGYWAARTAMVALQRESLDPARATQLQTALEQATGATFVYESLDAATADRVLASLTGAMYRTLAGKAAGNPAAAKHHQELVKQSAGLIPEKDRAALEAEFLATVLLQPEVNWQAYETALVSAATSPDDLTVLKMLDLYLGVKNPSLQDELADLLMTRAGAVPTSLKPVDVAAAVRRRISGVTGSAPLSGNGRWTQLRPLAADALATRGDYPKTPVAMMQQIIRTTHAATLAMAVAQQEPGFAVFDEVFAAGAPSLTGAAEAAKPAFDPSTFETTPKVGPTASNMEDLSKAIDDLALYEDLPVLMRINRLKILGKIAGRLRDLTPLQARRLVRYVFGARRPDEHEKIVKALPEVARWPQVRLAMADAVMAADISDTQLGEVVAAATRRRSPGGSGRAFRQQLRVQLMRSVLSGITTSPRTPDTTPGDKVYDEGPRRILESYRKRAELAGYNSDDADALGSVAEVLKTLVLQQSKTLAAATPEDQKMLDQLQVEIKAIEYAGGNPLRTAVLLQRVWLRLLAMHVGAASGDRAAANGILMQLETSDQGAVNAVHQFKDGELAILQMWMLMDPTR